MNTMSNGNSLTNQDGLVSNPRQQVQETTEQLATENMSRNIDENGQSDDHRSDSHIQYKSADNSGLIACLFIVFTCICTVVGTTIVCVTLSKQTDPPSRRIFKKSATFIGNRDSQPCHVAIGDFDQDDYTDIVVANLGANNIGIFYNNHGNGTFSNQITYSTGLDSHPRAVAVGHFNNDTYLDIVVADYAINSLGVFLGDGERHFNRRQVLTSLGPLHPASLAVGYFNNDNYSDIAVVSDGIFNLTLLFGSNNGSFDLGPMYDMGYDSMPKAIIAYDLNEDGQMDLAVVNYGTSELVLLINDGDGAFIMAKYSTGNGSYPLSLAVGDFDSDNITDIVVANSGTKTIGLFIGNGDGTVADMVVVAIEYQFQPQYVAVGDLNDDQHMDIIFLDANQNTASVLEGYGNGSFVNTGNSPTGTKSYPSSIAVGDFDNDQTQDVVITNNGTSNILVRTSYSRFTAATLTSYPIEEAVSPSSVRVAYLNDDGNLDLIFADVGTHTVTVRINLGNETFADDLYPMGNDSLPSFIGVVDIDNDNDTDIVVLLSWLSQISILLNLGNGTFIFGNKYSTSNNSQPRSLDIADLNNDSYPDIVTANGDGNDIGIFLGLGNGHFTNQTSLLADIQYSPTTVTTGDVNSDGAVDIVISSDQSGIMSILLGYGDGSFEDPELISTGNYRVLTHVLGDLNNDSRLDIVYTDLDCLCMVILLQNRNGTFQRIKSYDSARGTYQLSLALGYYNRDRFIDIAVVKRYDISIDIFLGDGTGLFPMVMQLDSLADSSIESVVFGDMNNDKKNDLIFADPGTSSILIFYAYDTIDFRYESSYTTGAAARPHFVTVASFPARRSTEVLVANSGTDTIQLLSNYNSTSFRRSTVLPASNGSHPQALTVADFDNDQILDIAAVSTWTGQLTVFTGRENGSFNTPSTRPTGNAPGSAPSSIASGDLNHDGRIDVVIANAGSSNVVVFLAFDYFRYNGFNIFVPGVFPQPYSTITGNFNNDALIDLAVVNLNNGSFLIYLGYGNGSFSDPVSNTVDSSKGLRFLRSGYFNNDSHTDLVVLDYWNMQIYVYLGYGNGSFELSDYYLTDDNSDPSSVAIADMNHDGHSDIIVACTDNLNIYIFEGTGNGSFSSRIAYSTIDPSSRLGITVADLDNDSNPDIIFADTTADETQIVFGYRDGTFGDILALFTEHDSWPVAIAIDDLNQDNRLDIVVANQVSNTISVFFNSGNRTFTSKNFALRNYRYTLQTVYISDVNNDIIKDILFINSDKIDGSVGIIYGLGNGQFTVPNVYLTGRNTQPTSISVGDFNRDGRVDLAVTYFNQDIINIMLQTGFDPFISYSSLSTGDQSSPQAVALQDLNNDANLDIVVANSGANNIGIFFGNGDGTFQNVQIHNMTGHSNPVALATGHFNNDGYFDIAVVNSATNTIVIFFGGVNGTFMNMISYFNGAGSTPVSIAAYDINADNATDLIVANRGRNEVVVFYGGNDGSFAASQSFTVGYDARPQSVTVRDMNGDNMVDILVANEGANNVDVLLQTYQPLTF